MLWQSFDESEPVGEVCPSPHAEHDVLSSSPYLPAGQVEQLFLASVSSLPAGQAMQDVRTWFVMSWYCPAPHERHSSSDVYSPLSQINVQSNDEVEPAGEVCPLAQLSHDARSLRPYLPAWQSRQELCPAPGVNLPAGQLMQPLLLVLG